MYHDFDRFFKCFTCSVGTVSFKRNAKSVIVSSVSDAHVLHFIVGTTDWSEDSVHSDSAYFHLIFLVYFSWYVAKSFFNLYVHFKLRTLVSDFTDNLLWVQNFNLTWSGDVSSSDDSKTIFLERNSDWFVTVK